MTTGRSGHKAGMRIPQERLWQGVALVSGTVAATLVRRLAVTTWRSTKHEDPPENPIARDVGWNDALTWAIAVGVGAAVARVVAQRGAAAAWEKATGDPPPIAA